MIRRRRLAAVLGALAAPTIAAAQPRQKRRLAYVHPTITLAAGMADRSLWSRAFFAELGRLGYTEATNLTVEAWSAKGETARYETLARDVLASKPDVVKVFTSRLAVGFRKAGGDIPVIFSGGTALAWGLVDSLAHPGGNLTGYSSEDDPALRTKAVELLHEIVPTAKAVAFLTQRSLWGTQYETTFGPAARSRGLAPRGALLNDPIGPAEYRRVFSEIGVRGVDLLVVGDMEENIAHRALIAELSAQYQLPAAYIGHAQTHVGELASYGIDPFDHARVMAGYVARVLDGAKPAEMPVRILDTYKLVINVKTAKALGLTVPPAILARAGEVIE